jgi:WD40 repeat protein
MLPTLSRVIAVPVLAACLTGIATIPSGLEKHGSPPQVPDSEAPRKDRHGSPLPPGAVGRLGTVRLRATANALAIHGDGKSILTVSGGRTVGRWDAQTGLLLSETHLPGAHDAISAFAPDGKTLAVVEETGISLWDLAAGKRMHFLPGPSGRCVFAPDGKTLVASQYKTRGVVHVWDVVTGKDRVLAELPEASDTRDFAFAPDGHRLYALLDDESLRAWDLQSGKQLWAIVRGATTLAVSSDGKTLLTNASRGSDLYLLDTDTAKHIGTMETTEKPWTATSHVALSPDGKRAAQAMWDGDTLLWEVDKRKVLFRFPQAGPHIAFAADGKSLFTAGALFLRWDVVTGKLLYTDARNDGHVGQVTSLAFAPGGRALATTADDGTLRLWELSDGSHRVLRTDSATRQIRNYGGFWHLSGAAPVRFSPDGRLLLTDVVNDTLALTDAKTGKEVRRFQLPKEDHNHYVPAVTAFSADGKMVLVQGVGRDHVLAAGLTEHTRSQPVYGWDVDTGLLILTRIIPAFDSGTGAFSPDGRLLIASSQKLVDLKTGGVRPLVNTPIELGEPLLAFSPDGRLLAFTNYHGGAGVPSGQGSSVNVYETITGRLISRTEAVQGGYFGLAFSHDGRLVAAPGREALYIWESATGKCLLRLEAKGRLTQWNAANFAACLAFAPDGNVLATGLADGTVLLWDLAKAGASLSAPTGPLDVEACWTDLALADAVKAQTAIARLAAAPTKSLPLLKQKLGPVQVDPAWLASRLEDLDSDKFPVREAAMRDLESVGDVVESDLRRFAERPPSEEVRARVMLILKRVDAGQAAVPPLMEVRKLRAVTVLERVGTHDARAHLRELAAGAPDARLTQAAKAALVRMEERR